MISDLVALIGRLWVLLSPASRRRFPLVVALMVLAAVMEAAALWMIAPLISIVVKESYADEPAARFLAHLVGPSSRMGLIAWTSGVLLLVYLIKNLYLWAVVEYQYGSVYAEKTRLLNRLYTHYIHSSYIAHLSRNPSTSVNNLTNVVDNLFANGYIALLNFMTEVFITSGVLVLLLKISPVALGAACVSIGIPVAIFYRYIKGCSSMWGKHVQEGTAKILKSITHGLRSIKEIKVYGREDYFINEFVRTTSSLNVFMKQFTVSNQLPRIFTETMAIGGILVIVNMLIRANHAFLEGFLPIVGVFLTASMRLMPTVSRMLGSWNAMQFAGPAIDQVSHDLAQRATSHEGTAKASRVRLQREMRLQDISFRYPNSKEDVLRHIDITVRKGEAVAFVGPSGAGKTTLVNIMLGLLRPSSGAILVDDVDVSASPEKLQGLMGYVPQNPYVMDETIRRCVAFGVDDSSIAGDRMTEAIRMAGLAGVIPSLPAGIDTPAGEDAANLSGGQRQRVGIARAIYNGRDILVLDEITSALDSHCEQEITDSLRALSGEKTIVLISHRRKLVEQCDRVYVLKDGMVVGSGASAALAKENPDFRKAVMHEC